MKQNRLLIMALAFAVIFMGCEDLEVENLNSPTQVAVLGEPSDFPGAVNGQFASFWAAIQQSSPGFALSVTAQAASMSWGNWGARDVGTIPRGALQNNLTYGSRALFTQAWNGLYGALGTTNAILTRIVVDGVVVPDDAGNDVSAGVVANGKAIQGLVHGYLGMLYNQAYTIDEQTDATTIAFVPYNDVIDFAIVKLEESIAMFSGSSLTMDGWNGLSYTAAEAVSILSGFVAKFEALRARNTTEAASVDWNKVLTNSSAATVSLSPIGDGGFTWWHRLLIQGQDGGWARVSQKVIKLMNPSKPATEVPYPWPDGENSFPEITTPDDNRITSDFSYSEGVDFSASRGYYFFSNYDYSRYEAYRSGFTEPMTFLSTDETDLLRAEALIRTGGDKAVAAGLINQTRVARGGLTALTGAESDDVLLNALTYERLIEFSWHGCANALFYRRMITPPGNTDAANLYYLEPLTARHLPVPAAELALFGEPFYTFGGSQGEQ